MFYVIIIDADRDHAMTLLDFVQKAPYEEIQASVMKSPQELEDYLDRGGLVDVLITDATFCGGERPDGIELVRRRFPFGCGTQVIYLTEHAEYATRAYRTQHVYFLVEPAAPEDFADALDRAFNNLRSQTNRPLGVRSDGRIQVIQPRKISYIESDRRKLHIHVGSDTVTTYATLDSVAHELPSSFVRSHKSFLVNMGAIESFDTTHVTLFSGEVVPVSQKRRKATHEAFSAYVSSRA